MKRRWTIAVTAALAAATISAAAPAQARPADCELGPAPEGTVVENQGGGDIYIHPTNAPGDALAYAGWIGAYVSCLENGIVTGPLNCVEPGNLPDVPQVVTFDPDTLTIGIHLDELFVPADPDCSDD